MKTILRWSTQGPLAVFWFGVALLAWPMERFFCWLFEWERLSDWWGFATMGFHLHDKEWP